MRPSTPDPARSWTQLTLGGGLASAGLGGFALAGWLVGSPALSGFGADRIPMAPSTGLLFLLFGLAVAAHAGRPRDHRVPVLPLLMAGAGMLAATGLLVLAIAGVRSDLEYLGMPITGSAGGVPVGHMSPLTAFAFLLVGAAYLLGRARDPWRARASLLLASGLELIGLTLTAGYLLSRPLLYHTGVIPPALNTSMGFVALGLGLLGIAAQRVWPGEEEGRPRPRPAYWLMATAAAMTAAILLPAYLLFSDYHSGYEEEVEAQLLAVADLKVGQISAWREELLRDALFYDNPVFGDLVDSALYGSDTAAERRLEAMLSPMQRGFRYVRLAVFDTAGEARVVIPDSGRHAADQPHSREDVLRVMASGRVSLEGFHRDSPDGPVHMSVVAPVRRGDRVVGAVVHRVDPGVYLYPVLLRWPVPSRTAETLLVRREGDDVLFLNDLRFQDDAAFRLRHPLDDPRLPAARAVRGETGIVEGVDYRGKPVVAAVRPVPDSPWYLVARVDTEEVYGPLRQRLGWTLALVGFLFGAAGAGLGFLWQRREKIHYRELAVSEQRHRALLHSVGDAVIATDAAGRIELMNPVAERLTGWAAGEAVGRPLAEVFRLVDETTREPAESPFARVMETGRVIGLANSTILLARDGSERPIADSGAPVRGADGEITGVILVFRDQTLERQARRVLVAREERYRSLFNSIRDAIVVADTDRRIIDGNAAFTQLFGYEIEDVEGKQTEVLYASADEFLRMGRELQEHMGEQDFTLSVHFRKKSGEVFPGDTHAFYLRDADGAITGFIGVIRDTSERVAAEVALRESEERYRTLYEAAPVGIFRTRSDGSTLAVNRTMARILGFDDTDELLAHYSRLETHLYVRPERRAEFLEELRSKGQVAGFRYQARRGDGETIWIEMDARIADGDVEGGFDIEGFAWDVTARKEAEDALHRHQRMLERTEQIARIGSWELDVETGQASWSDELFWIFQRTPTAEATPLSESPELFPDPDLEHLRDAVRAAVEDGSPYDIEVRALRSDGQLLHCRAQGHPERDADGRVVKLYGYLADISEEKDREDREVELRAQLAQAQKMEAVGRLAGGVAHDFNNMLSIILGHTEMAQDRLDADDPTADDLAKIRQAAESSADLTRQLLAFAREQVATPKVLDLNETISSLLKMLRRLIGEEVELSWKPSGDIWPVRLDPVQVDQVLANLLVNARDAIGGVGGVAITTECVTVSEEEAADSPDAAPGDYVALTVTDTGAGMDAETRGRIFEPFFTTKNAGEGTGLGLATVYGIVRQNDGFITVDSSPGQGTTFRIHFPRSRDAAAPVRAPAPDPTPPPRGEETVLVVEDQPAVLNLVRKILDRAGYTVLCAQTPREALDLVRGYAGPLQLLVTDVIMPEMNGRELADRLLTTHPHLAVLFMSGYAADIIVDRGVLREGVRFVEKPFTSAELTERVRDALDARSDAGAEGGADAVGPTAAR